MIVLGLGGYIVYDKIISKESGKPKETTKNEKNEPKQVTKSIKLDTSKDYIYDADYNYNGKYTEYKMPFINIDSKAAIEINGYLKGLYDSYMKDYTECAPVDSSPGCSITLGYEKYVNEKIVSVVIRYSKTFTSVPDPTYITYNFDISTGKLMNYSEVLNKLNITKENAKLRIEDSIKNNKTSANEINVEYTQKNISDGIDYFEIRSTAIPLTLDYGLRLSFIC